MKIFAGKATGKTPKAGAIFAVVLVLSMVPSLGTAAEESVAVERKFGSLEKSLLLPGWGQISEHRVLKGAAFAAAELAFLAGALYHNGRGNSNYEFYQTATDPASASRYRDLVERHDSRRNAFLLAAAAVWAANLLDIFLIVNQKETDTNSPSLSFGIGHGPSRETYLSIGYRF